MKKAATKLEPMGFFRVVVCMFLFVCVGNVRVLSCFFSCIAFGVVEQIIHNRKKLPQALLSSSSSSHFYCESVAALCIIKVIYGS